MLGQDPFSGHVFCFRGRRGDLVKLLWWDGGGLCLYATGPGPRIRVLRRGEGAGGEHPARWKSLGPAAPGSRIDFVRYEIPPSTVLGPATAHAPGTVEHMHSGHRHPSASPWAMKRRNSPQATAAAAAPTPHMGSRTPTRRSRRLST